jgi:hypothetical protein
MASTSIRAALMIDQTILSADAAELDTELGPLYDPRCRAAHGIILLSQAALTRAPEMAAGERARYEALIEQAEAVLMLGDVMAARLAKEEAQGRA